MALKVIKAFAKLVTSFDTDYEEETLRGIGANLVKVECTNEESAIAAAHDADAIIDLNSPWTRKVIENLEKCKVISCMHLGYDNIDVTAATEHGIIIANVPDYCLEEVSDHAMALLLACARKLFQYDRVTRSGQWMVLLPPVHRLRGQTVGVIGMGQIGQTLVPKAKGFGFKVIAYDPYAPGNVADKLGIELVDLDRLLKESDYITIHAALTPQNRNMLGLEQFKQMKPTAYLINTARGAHIDEQALYTALSEGYIAGAGLDVLDVKDPTPPKPDNPLLKLDNVIITAHSAHYSHESFQTLIRRPADEIVKVMKSEWPYGLINPEVKQNFASKWGKAQ